MRDLRIENRMSALATELIRRRYPKGWGGAALVHTAQGHDFTSVALESANSSVLLCIEVGAMCEAHKCNERVTHCLCVVRDDESAPFKTLTPCGVCQERLRYWGTDVQVGVSTRDNSLLFVPLRVLQPHHWSAAYPLEELEHYVEPSET